jgi:predicted dehydrogenase
MKVGVIGTGVMGRNHLRVYAEMKAVTEVRVFDVVRASAEEAAGRVDATVADSFEAVLDFADAVSICVPTPYHLGMAERAADAGVPMLIEKPICATVAEGERLLDRLPSGLVVGVGQIERFNPIVGEIRKIVRDPLYVELKRHNPASTRITGTSIVEDLMIHDIDILAHVLFPGMTSTVASAGTGDICSAVFSFDHCHAYLSASRKSSKKIRSIYIEEEERTIEGDFMSQEVFVHRKPGRYTAEAERYVQENIIEKVLVNRVEPLRVELTTFLGAVAGGPPFPVTPSEGIENLRIAAAVSSGIRGP